MGWQGQTLDAAVLDAIIDAAPIAIGVFDADLRFMRANRAMAELNGMPEEEHVGRRLDEALPRIHADSLAAAQTVLATGEPVGPIEVSSTILPGRHFVVSFFPVSSGEDGAAIRCPVQDVTGGEGPGPAAEELPAVAGRLAGAPPRAEVTDLILTAGRELVDAEGVAAALLDP